MDRQIDRHMDRQIDRHRDRHMDRQIDRHTDRHTDRLTDRETNRHTDRQTYPKYTLVKARHKVGLWTTPFFFPSIITESIKKLKKNTYDV